MMINLEEIYEAYEEAWSSLGAKIFPDNFEPTRRNIKHYVIQFRILLELRDEYDIRSF